MQKKQITLEFKSAFLARFSSFLEKKDFALSGACFSCPYIEPRYITIYTGGPWYDDDFVNNE